MPRKPVDLTALPANFFFKPVRGRAGSMSPAVAQEIDASAANFQIERRKRGIRRALAAAPVARAPEAGLLEQIREAQVALIRNMRSEWDRLEENTQELLLEAVAGMVRGTVSHKDYANAIMGARKELRGPPTAPPRITAHAWCAPLNSGW
jgi:hypothetical protein